MYVTMTNEKQNKLIQIYSLLSAKSFCEVKIRAGFLVWNSALFGYLWIAKLKNDNHEQKYTFRRTAEFIRLH